MKPPELAIYRDLLGDIKTRVRQAQHRAALSAHGEMILMYWDIGRMIAARQAREGWGTGVIPHLAADLKNELPDQKGFSERNLGYMIRFAGEYGTPPDLQQLAANIPSGSDTSRLPQECLPYTEPDQAASQHHGSQETSFSQAPPGD